MKKSMLGITLLILTQSHTASEPPPTAPTLRRTPAIDIPQRPPLYPALPTEARGVWIYQDGHYIPIDTILSPPDSAGPYGERSLQSHSYPQTVGSYSRSTHAASPYERLHEPRIDLDAIELGSSPPQDDRRRSVSSLHSGLPPAYGAHDTSLHLPFVGAAHIALTTLQTSMKQLQRELAKEKAALVALQAQQNSSENSPKGKRRGSLVGLGKSKTTRKMEELNKQQEQKDKELREQGVNIRRITAVALICNEYLQKCMQKTDSELQEAARTLELTLPGETADV